MQQNMTEEELELLKQIQEDLNLAKQEYGCKMDRKKLLAKVLERDEHSVRPEETELFFSGVLPSGWKSCYFREPKMLSASMVKLRKAISIDWCKNYLEPELRGLQGSESLRDCVVSISQMKKDLKLPLRKENMLSSHKQVESYLREMRSKAGIVPDFRFIPPGRFAAIVDIYLEAMEERGDCTQEELGRLLGMTQSAVSKLRKLQITISAEKEFRVLLSLFVLHVKDDIRRILNMQDIHSYYQNMDGFYMNQMWIKKNRMCPALYLTVLLGFPIGHHTSLPATVADINLFLEKQCFDERFDPDVQETFDTSKPKKIEYHAIPLWSLIRLHDYPYYTEEKEQEILNEIMQMDAAHLRLLHQMPRVFFTDLLPADLGMERYLEEMRQFRQPGLKCLMSKMETIVAGWDVFLPRYGRITWSSSAYFKDFFQLMEYLSDERYYPDIMLITWEDIRRMNCNLAIFYRNKLETAKPLTDSQKQEYRALFEKNIGSNRQRNLLERIRFKFSMTMQEWYFWLKMELLWFSMNNIKDWHERLKSWGAFMNQCMEEARKADRDKAGTAPDT